MKTRWIWFIYNLQKNNTIMRRCLVYLAGLLSLFIICSCDDDYVLDVFGAVSGQITDYITGESISGAQVTLIPVSAHISGSFSAQTGSDGLFSFEGLEEGKYVVSVQKYGYRPDHKDVIVISGETVQVVIAMEIIPK